MILNKNFVDFITLLNKNKVKYVLIGGGAVICEGYTRNTGDMDFFVERSDENALNLLKVIKELVVQLLALRKKIF